MSHFRISCLHVRARFTPHNSQGEGGFFDKYEGVEDKKDKEDEAEQEDDKEQKLGGRKQGKFIVQRAYSPPPPRTFKEPGPFDDLFTGPADGDLLTENAGAAPSKGSAGRQHGKAVQGGILGFEMQAREMKDKAEQNRAKRQRKKAANAEGKVR